MVDLDANGDVVGFDIDHASRKAGSLRSGNDRFAGYRCRIARLPAYHHDLLKRHLRSARWYEAEDLRSFGHRSRTLQMGYDYADFIGKPVVAIINTWSDINPCHAHFRTRAEEVKRGVWQAGGFPVEMPALSLSENFVKPTTMLYRNLLALEVEELLRSHPVDGAVLLGGCDKTTPATLMGAISMNLPAIFLPAGPMLRGNYAGRVLGSRQRRVEILGREAGGADHRRRNGAAWRPGIARSFGTCMVMGTASTMTALAETLGMTLPGASSIPAADSAHARMATACGRRIVDMIREDLKPRDVLTASLLRECARRPDGARRLDQRHHPPDRDGRARRHAISTSTISTGSPASPGARQSPSVRRLS